MKNYSSFAKMIFSFFVLSFISFPALASDWEYLAYYNDTTSYIDMDSITKDESNENHVKFWSKNEYGPNSGREGSLIFQEIVDCKNKTYSIITVSVYNKKGISIKVVEGDYPNTNPIVPDSLGESKMNIACNTRPL